MLGQCGALAHLNLRGNRIGADGAGRLAGVLGQCGALAHLDPQQLQDILEEELKNRCLEKIGPHLLEYGISQLHEMRYLLRRLTVDDLKEDSEFRHNVPLSNFQVRNLRLWKSDLGVLHSTEGEEEEEGGRVGAPSL